MKAIKILAVVAFAVGLVAILATQFGTGNDATSSSTTISPTVDKSIIPADAKPAVDQSHAGQPAASMEKKIAPEKLTVGSALVCNRFDGNQAGCKAGGCRWIPDTRTCVNP
jgi:hypothetical protein